MAPSANEKAKHLLQRLQLFRKESEVRVVADKAAMQLEIALFTDGKQAVMTLEDLMAHRMTTVSPALFSPKWCNGENYQVHFHQGPDIADI